MRQTSQSPFADLAGPEAGIPQETTSFVPQSISNAWTQFRSHTRPFNPDATPRPAQRDRAYTLGGVDSQLTSHKGNEWPLCQPLRTPELDLELDFALDSRLDRARARDLAKKK